MKRTHMIVLGLIVIALILWLMMVRPRVLGQGERQSPETGSVQRQTGR